jgi:hypothetical protein
MFLYPEALPRHPCRGYCPVPCLLSRLSSTVAEPPGSPGSFGLSEGLGASRVVVEWTGAIANKDDTVRLRRKDGTKESGGEVDNSQPRRDTSGNAERLTESRKGLVRVYAPTFPRLYHQTMSLGISIREGHSLEGSAHQSKEP